MANMANVLGLIFANMHEQSVADLTKKRTLASVPFGGRWKPRCCAGAGLGSPGGAWHQLPPGRLALPSGGAG